MVGYAELVRRSRTRLPEQRVDACLDEVISAGYRARDLIAQMLAFSRASRGAPRSIDLAATIDDVSRMLRAAIPGVVELRTEQVGRVSTVFADPVQIQQIVINLLVNARDALADRGAGRIDVLLKEEQPDGVCSACGRLIEGPKVVLTVEDSGHGIDPDVRSRLFEMYFTTRAPGKGTGLGLWLVNRLVHEHEGHVIVDSSPGNGARFSVVFPFASDSVAAAENPGAARGHAQRTGRVVLVDDEVSVANFMSEALRDAGYEVVVFNESLPALRYLEQHHAHVTAVLTAEQMPLLSGVDLTTRLRELRPDLPIALVGAPSDSGTAGSRSGSLFDRVLSKPFQMDELVGLLEELSALRG
ncbi:MAG: ATP-binding protein [Pseudomonadales bacterium]